MAPDAPVSTSYAYQDPPPPPPVPPPEDPDEKDEEEPLLLNPLEPEPPLEDGGAGRSDASPTEPLKLCAAEAMLSPASAVEPR